VREKREKRKKLKALTAQQNPLAKGQSSQFHSASVRVKSLSPDASVRSECQAKM
jgi:hypothetical protein